MPQALVRIATTALLALAAAWGNAQSGDWGDVTIISSTAGNNSNRLCMGVPDHMRPADIGCPSYAPSLSTAGHVSITGNVSANKFIGDGNGLTNLNVQGDRIISNTHAVIINENTGYISLTTSGGTWGYFSAGWSLLANLLANTVSSSLVSATSVSATYVDATRNGTVSGTFGYFRYVSGTDMYGRFTGDGSGLTGVIAGATDRIVSGTNAATRMVAISDTGYISITQAGANSGWFDPYRGLVTLGVSATGPVSGTSGYFGEGVAIGKAGRLATLDVGGTISASDAIQVGASSLACSTGISGAIRFNSGDIQYCNGVSWVTLSGGGVADWYSISNIPAQVIAISDSTSISMQMVSASALNAYYVSGTQGYFPAATILALSAVTIGSNSVSSSLVSATNVSASFVDTTRNGAVSGTYGYFRYISGTQVYGTFVGDGSGITNLNVQGDRIVSGTTQAIANNGGNIEFKTGSTVTGWYSPAGILASVGVSTTDRISASDLFVRGNVGIGTALPTAPLQIVGGTGANVATLIDNNKWYAAKGTGGSAIRLLGLANTGDVYLGAVDVNTGKVIFRSNGSDRAVIDNSGNVGVGTPSPNATLHVSGTIRIADGGEACDGDRAGAIRYTSGSVFEFCKGSGWESMANAAGNVQSDRIVSGTTRILASEDRSITFTTANSDRMILGENGYLGVGLANPSYPLHIVGSSMRLQNTPGSAVYMDVLTSDAQSAYLRFSTGNSSRWLMGADNSDSNKFKMAYAATNFTGAVQFALTSGGNLGLGTVTPATPLDISNSIAKITLNDTSGVYGGAINFQNSGTLKWQLGAGIDGVDMDSFGLANGSGLAKMFVTSAGNFGIGTTAPSATLHVSGTIKVAGTGAEACDANMRGGMRRNPSSGLMELCQ